VQHCCSCVYITRFQPGTPGGVQERRVAAALWADLGGSVQGKGPPCCAEPDAMCAVDVCENCGLSLAARSVLAQSGKDAA
jgi:hypothetical protein